MGETPDYVIDGTERRRQRPTSPEKQAIHYSGKKKHHTDKNIIVSHAQSGRVGYLSPTRPGTVHDKKLAEHEQIHFPRQSVVHKDTGFQGYEPPVKQTLQPKKKPRGKELTPSEKRNNRKLSRMRVVVEHTLSGVKRRQAASNAVAVSRTRCATPVTTALTTSWQPPPRYTIFVLTSAFTPYGVDASFFISDNVYWINGTQFQSVSST